VKAFYKYLPYLLVLAAIGGLVLHSKAQKKQQAQLPGTPLPGTSTNAATAGTAAATGGTKNPPPRTATSVKGGTKSGNNVKDHPFVMNPDRPAAGFGVEGLLPPTWRN
jgi:hypothetical protein